MIRVTTNGIIKGYKSHLMKSGNNRNDAMNRVLTQRNFNSYAEDPAAASQAFRLRRARSRALDQISNGTTAISVFGSAWTSLGAVKESLTGEISAVSDAMKGISDSTGDAREALAQSLKSKAESIVQDLNVKYADSFIFSGADGKNVPFKWEDNKLYFRDIPVDSGGVAEPTQSRVDAPDAWAAYDEDQANLKALEKMTKETNFVDLGMGLKENPDGSLVAASGFNVAISGVDILGYGVDADGDPKNVVSIIQKLADVFENSKDGTFTAAQREDADRLLNKLQDASDAVTAKWTELDGKSSYLKTNKSRLEDYRDTVTEEILSIEQVNLADAITELSWAQQCYNSALKVGNSILSQSLIDYMN